MRRSEKYLLIAGMIFMFVFGTNPLTAGTDTTVISDTLREEKSNESKEQPNMIIFAMDDLNDWVGPLGYSQAKTPNLDRLAKSGITFLASLKKFVGYNRFR